MASTKQQLSKLNSARVPRGLHFPDDLSREAGNGHWIQFHILKSAGVSAATTESVAASLGNNEGFGSTLKEGSKAAGTAILDLNATLSEKRKKADNLIEQIEKTGITTENKDEYFGSVTLFLPGDRTTTYGLDYKTGEMSRLASGAGISEGVVAALGSGVGDAAKEAATSIGKAIGGSVGRGALNLALGEGSFAKIFGLTNNPHMQMIFETVSPREFTFTFQLTPRSFNEVRSVYRIIHLFKYHAHPEVVARGMFFNMPEEFVIKYITVDKRGKKTENTFLNKIGRSVLTNIEVNYTPNSVWSSFGPRDEAILLGDQSEDSKLSIDIEGAAPTAVDLTLQFSEIKALSREDISQGF